MFGHSDRYSFRDDAQGTSTMSRQANVKLAATGVPGGSFGTPTVAFPSTALEPAAAFPDTAAAAAVAAAPSPPAAWPGRCGPVRTMWRCARSGKARRMAAKNDGA